MDPVIAHSLGLPAFGPLVKTADGGYKLQGTEFDVDGGLNSFSNAFSKVGNAAPAFANAGLVGTPISRHGTPPPRPASWENLKIGGFGLQEASAREATPTTYRQSTPRQDVEERAIASVGSFPGVVKEKVGIGDFYPPECRPVRAPMSPWPDVPWPSTATTTTASAHSPLLTGAIEPGSPGDRSAESNLRSKLLEMGTTFLGFEKVVEEDTVRRRHIEQQRIQEVLDGLQKLEKRLNVEIKRRMEANTNSEEVMEKLLSDMLIRVQGRIIERFELMMQSIESLFTRLSTLERGIQQFKGELPTNLQVETASLAQAIRELSTNFEDDRRQRLEIDQLLMKRVEESDCSVDMRIEQELATLERCAETLQSDLEDFSAEVDAPVPPKWAGLLENLAQTRSGITQEAQKRENVDDQVVQAINQYTSALQRTLSISNQV